MGADTIHEDNEDYDLIGKDARHDAYKRAKDQLTALTYTYGLRAQRTDMPDLTDLSAEVQAILNEK